jgi:two-component system, NtrC family, sensor kinase
VANSLTVSSTYAFEPPATALAAVVAVAARLADGAPLDESMPGVLAILRASLGAREAAVWLQRPDGLTRVWGVGEPGLSGTDVIGGLESRPTGDAPAGEPLVAQLAHGARRVGALALRGARPLDADGRMLLAAVADLLTPAVTHADYLRQLEREVQLRTREMEEQRRFTQRIIDSLPLGLYVIDREYRIQAWNRKRETGTQGVSREEAIGRTIFEILHRQPAELLRGEFDDVFATGRIQQFEVVSETTGDPRTYRLSKIPMRVDDAAVTHVITIGEDITEWREAQERFAQAEKLAAIGTLAAGVMHEINNPLATIAACAESLTLRLDELTHAGAPPAGATNGVGDYLKIIDDEVHRCKRIVDGLLDFSRPKPATRTPVDLNAVIEQTLFLLKHHARFKKLAVARELDPALGADVVGNPEQLVQVFMALLLNAVDAMQEHGTVTVRTRRGRGDVVVAEVGDEGHGIRRGDVNKIFEPFYTTKPPGRGTGLGLSICYGIVADHGGRIEVDSAPRKGSTFRIILPTGQTP